MSLSDCPECWNTPCSCGYEYKGWSNADIVHLMLVLSKELSTRDLSIPDPCSKNVAAPRIVEDEEKIVHAGGKLNLRGEMSVDYPLMLRPDGWINGKIVSTDFRKVKCARCNSEVGHRVFITEHGIEVFRCPACRLKTWVKRKKEPIAERLQRAVGEVEGR